MKPDAGVPIGLGSRRRPDGALSRATLPERYEMKLNRSAVGLGWDRPLGAGRGAMQRIAQGSQRRGRPNPGQPLWRTGAFGRTPRRCQASNMRCMSFVVRVPNVRPKAPSSAWFVISSLIPALDRTCPAGPKRTTRRGGGRVRGRCTVLPALRLPGLGGTQGSRTLPAAASARGRPSPAAPTSANPRLVNALTGRKTLARTSQHAGTHPPAQFLRSSERKPAARRPARLRLCPGVQGG